MRYPDNLDEKEEAKLTVTKMKIYKNKIHIKGSIREG